MSDTRDRDIEWSTTTPGTTPDDLDDDTFHVSSLRPMLGGFSQRRLLNVASIAVAVIVVLALAIHWLPDVLPKPPTVAERHRMHAQQTLIALRPPIRGSGWKPIGPDWAQDIAFTANGALGYVCGAYPPNPIVFFGVYDVHQNAWKQLPTPATGDRCRVSVSPTNPTDVVIIADSCPEANCGGHLPVSQVYRSHDGGANWSLLNLPRGLLVGDVAWTSTTLFLAGADYTTATSAPYTLFAIRPDGSFTAIDARQMVGHTMDLSYIVLTSSGAALYASVTPLPCSSYCTTWLRTADDGHTWTPLPSTHQGNPLDIAAAQPNTSVLIGRTFQPGSGVLTPLRSTDEGMHWAMLPPFPANPSTGGAVPFVLPDGSIYAFCFGSSNVVYELRNGAGTWRIVASLPTGDPLAVQYDSSGHAVALWGQAINPTSAIGLEYYPLRSSAP